MNRKAGQALVATGVGLGAGTAAAIGTDSLVNDQVNHTKSVYNQISNTLNNNPELGQAWNYVFGNDGFAPIQKQSLSRVLLGRGDEIDISILAETGAMPRVEELVTKRPDLAESLGVLAQFETKVNVDQIANDISNQELMDAREAYSLPSLVTGAAAGGAGAYGANAAYGATADLIKRFKKG